MFFSFKIEGDFMAFPVSSPRAKGVSVKVCLMSFLVQLLRSKLIGLGSCDLMFLMLLIGYRGWMSHDPRWLGEVWPLLLSQFRIVVLVKVKRDYWLAIAALVGHIRCRITPSQVVLARHFEDSLSADVLPLWGMLATSLTLIVLWWVEARSIEFDLFAS